MTVAMTPEVCYTRTLVITKPEEVRLGGREGGKKGGEGRGEGREGKGVSEEGRKKRRREWE